MTCCICHKDIQEPALHVSARYVPEDQADAAEPSTQSLTLNGKPVCRECGHTVSHLYPFGKDPAVPADVTPIPCPVVNEKNEVIPFGTYPNIDWS